MSQSNFERCMDEVFKHEGGLSLIRADPGNWTGGKVGKGELRGTKYGIAAHAHPAKHRRNPLTLRLLKRGQSAVTHPASKRAANRRQAFAKVPRRSSNRLRNKLICNFPAPRQGLRVWRVRSFTENELHH
jgi:hypothetical protein